MFDLDIFFQHKEHSNFTAKNKYNKTKYSDQLYLYLVSHINFSLHMSCVWKSLDKKLSENPRTCCSG